MNTRLIGALGALLIILVATFALTEKADAAYGGCNEVWRAPHSQVAETCRDRGWTIRARMVLDPTNRVRVLVGLKPCVYEDSEGCYWNAKCMGNGRGDSFVRINHRTWYVSFGPYECRA